MPGELARPSSDAVLVSPEVTVSSPGLLPDRARASLGEHLIRRSGQTVQGCPVVAVCWPDVPGLSFCVGSWLWPWLQSWLQSRGCPQPERANPNRISSSGHGCPDRFKLDQPSRPVFPGWYCTVVNCNPNCKPQIRSNGRPIQGCPLRATCWAGLPVLSARIGGWLPDWQQCWQQCTPANLCAAVSADDLSSRAYPVRTSQA